jgi:hypothetical protein
MERPLRELRESTQILTEGNEDRIRKLLKQLKGQRLR